MHVVCSMRVCHYFLSGGHRRPMLQSNSAASFIYVFHICIFLYPRFLSVKTQCDLSLMVLQSIPLPSVERPYGTSPYGLAINSSEISLFFVGFRFSNLDFERPNQQPGWVATIPFLIVPISNSNWDKQWNSPTSILTLWLVEWSESICGPN